MEIEPKMVYSEPVSHLPLINRLKEFYLLQVISQQLKDLKVNVDMFKCEVSSVFCYII